MAATRTGGTARGSRGTGDIRPARTPAAAARRARIATSTRTAGAAASCRRRPWVWFAAGARPSLNRRAQVVAAGRLYLAAASCRHPQCRCNEDKEVGLHAGPLEQRVSHGRLPCKIRRLRVPSCATYAKHRTRGSRSLKPLAATAPRSPVFSPERRSSRAALCSCARQAPASTSWPSRRRGPTESGRPRRRRARARCMSRRV